MVEQKKDTSVSLSPLTFEEAMRELAKTKHTDSETEGSGGSTTAVPESETSKKRTVRRLKSSSH